MSGVYLAADRTGKHAVGKPATCDALRVERNHKPGRSVLQVRRWSHHSFECRPGACAQIDGIFLADATARWPAYGGARKFHQDPHWKDCILFYEYFHGDNGAGLGASHQAGWTGVIARVIDLFARGSAADWLEVSRSDLAARMTRAQVAG